MIPPYGPRVNARSCSRAHRTSLPFDRSVRPGQRRVPMACVAVGPNGDLPSLGFGIDQHVAGKKRIGPVCTR